MLPTFSIFSPLSSVKVSPRIYTLLLKLQLKLFKGELLQVPYVTGAKHFEMEC